MCALVYKIQIPFLGQVDARGTQKKNIYFQIAYLNHNLN